MTPTFKGFLTDESGAITVDWVVLTAAALSLGMLAVMLIAESVQDHGETASNLMEDYDIDDEFDTD